MGLAQSTVSEHLRILKDAGIVMGTIDYPRVCYSLDPSALAPIGALIKAIAVGCMVKEASAKKPADKAPEFLVPGTEPMTTA